MQLSRTPARCERPCGSSSCGPSRRIPRSTACGVLVGLTSLGLLLSTCADASGRMRAGVRTLSDATVDVVSPRVDATAEWRDELTVTPYWTADAISAATPVMNAPDTVSRATTFEETRHESGIGLTWRPLPILELGTSYSASVERDYLAHTIGLTSAVDLFERTSTVSLGVRGGIDEVGRSDVPDFERELFTVGADLGWTQVLTPELLLSATWGVEHRSGYQANPYRLVPIYDRIDGPGASSMGARPRFTVGERVPDVRTRHSAAARLAWHAGHDIYMHGGVRAYADDWGIVGPALDLAAWFVLAEDIVRIGLRSRGSWQSAADFYRARYTSTAGYRTGDYRAAEMWTASGGLRLDLRLGELVAPWGTALRVSYDATWFGFEDVPVRDAMIAHMPALGLLVETP